jgi:hypothetical protein
MAQIKQDGLINAAVAELERVLAGADAAATEQVSDQSEIVGQQEGKRGAMNIKKGANQNRKRNALGRGLSALMTSNSLEVPYQTPENNASRSWQDIPTNSEISRATAQEEPVATPVMSVVIGGKQTEGLLEVALDQLVANPKQPRQRFFRRRNCGTFSVIIALGSVCSRSSSVLVAMVKTAMKSSRENGRFRAATRAGLTSVPVLVRDLSDQEVLEGFNR